MKLLLIRHGETEHNVAGKLAGVTDSALTNHGMLQIQRLGRSLAARSLHFTHVYSSDLRRAFLTANAVCEAQSDGRLEPPRGVRPLQLTILREQDFGSYECQPWASRRTTDRKDETAPQPGDPGFKPKETSDAMTKRMEIFLDDYIVPLLATDQEEQSCMAVVSHGIILSVLWRSLLLRFGTRSVSLAPEVNDKARMSPLENLPGWSNTGYLELDISTVDLYAAYPRTAGSKVLAEALVGNKSDEGKKLSGWELVIRAVNRKDHLNHLKRTRGGLGSSTFDSRQKRLEMFFPTAGASQAKEASPWE